MFKFLCVVEIVMSTAYVMSCVYLGGGGMSEVYMLKSLDGSFLGGSYHLELHF